MPRPCRQRRITDLKGFIGLAAQGRSLTRAQAELAFDIMMSGEATPAQMGGLLMAMRVRGETIDEITGAVTAMRAKMLRISALPDAIDVCGTGGDQAGTLNISTARRRSCARPATCRSPSTATARPPPRAARPTCWPRSASTSTPISRPSSARWCEVGIHLHVGAAASQRHAPRRPDPRRARHPHHLQHHGPAVEPGRREAPAARRVRASSGWSRSPQVLKQSRHRACLGGPWRRRPRRDHHHRPSPMSAELQERQHPPLRDLAERCRPAAIATAAELKGGDPAHNAQAIRELFDGAVGPYRDIVLLNAAAALVVAGSGQGPEARASRWPRRRSTAARRARRSRT